MTTSETQYVTDDSGRRIAVLVGVDRYAELLEAVEELDAVRAYDEAKEDKGVSVPFEDAVREIERDRTG
ncbi:MAG: hypothetical protein ACI80V_002188 [Rhodothermales bacterium]|jgi:hypothetical protein